MLTIFSGFYSSVFPCFPQMCPFCVFCLPVKTSLLHKNILCFPDLCTSTSGNPLRNISLCTPGMVTPAWRPHGIRMVLLSTAELTNLHRSCMWNDVFCTWQDFLLQWLNTVQEFLGAKRVWGGTSIWTLCCSIYLTERVSHLGGDYWAAALLGVMQKWTSGMCKFSWGLFVAVLEALHWVGAGKPLAQVPAVLLLEIWAAEWEEAATLLHSEVLKCDVLAISTVHISVSKWASTLNCVLCVECTGLKQICICFKLHPWLGERTGVLPQPPFLLKGYEAW